VASLTSSEKFLPGASQNRIVIAKNAAKYKNATIADYKTAARDESHEAAI
jgi:hypothetical protein